MSALDDRRRLEELYLPSANDFVLVDVPDLQFVMIEGRETPAARRSPSPPGGSSP